METETFVIDKTAIVAEAAALVQAEMKAEHERAKAQADHDKSIAEEAYKLAREEVEKEFKAKETAWQGKPAAFNTRVGKNDKSAGKDEFANWMKTGDDGNQKVLKYIDLSGYDEAGKALQVGSDTEGGYAAPDDFYGSIVEQRDQMSWVRNVGINFWPTDKNKVQVPTEATKMSKFEVTAEEGSYSDSDPIFGNVELQIYKFTRMNKFSEELLSDEAAGLMDWYSRSLSRALAMTESYYVTLGSGSSQPTGTTIGGTAGLTADTLALTAGEISTLFHTLGNGYRKEAVWLFNDNTLGILRGIRDSSNWAFDPNGVNLHINANDWQYETFFGGRPVYVEEGMATNAASAKVAVFGNYNFYMFAEHTNLVVIRNPYLYEASGQVAFFARSRWGGAPTQATAFQYATLAGS